MKTQWIRTVTVAVAIAQPSAQVLAQGIREERIAFKTGSTSATLSGSIKGDETVDYLVNARAGQSMKVTLKTSNGANYFNVLPPGSEAAIAVGATIGNEWSGALPADGDYRIRLFLMRSAARRNETATYTVTVGITGSVDAKVAGTAYHATGDVPCSFGPDPKGSAKCSFGVIRKGAGAAEVYLASPGFDVKVHKDDLRILHFVGDKVTSQDASERVIATKEGDNWLITVNHAFFYTIPEAVILGG